jgi:hypothetical protein
MRAHSLCNASAQAFAAGRRRLSRCECNTQHATRDDTGAARRGQPAGPTSWSFARASSCFFFASFESSVTLRAVRTSAAPPQSAAVTVTCAHGPHATRGHARRPLGGAAAERGDSSCDGQREITVQHARGAAARTGAIEGRARSDRRVCGSAIDAFTLARSSCIENPRVMCNSASVQQCKMRACNMQPCTMLTYRTYT